MPEPDPFTEVPEPPSPLQPFADWREGRIPIQPEKPGDPRPESRATQFSAWQRELHRWLVTWEVVRAEPYGAPAVAPSGMTVIDRPGPCMSLSGVVATDPDEEPRTIRLSRRGLAIVPALSALETVFVRFRAHGQIDGRADGGLVVARHSAAWAVTADGTDPFAAPEFEQARRILAEVHSSGPGPRTVDAAGTVEIEAAIVATPPDPVLIGVEVATEILLHGAILELAPLGSLGTKAKLAAFDGSPFLEFRRVDADVDDLVAALALPRLSP